MAESAQPIAAVNATSTTEAPQSQQAQKTENKPKSFKDKIEETLWRVNEPGGNGLEDNSEPEPRTPSISAIVDKVQADAKVKLDSKPETKIEEPTKVEQPKELQKRKFKFDGKDVELDEANFERYVQKGMLLDRKGADITRMQRDAQAKINEAQAREAKAVQTLEALQNGSLDVLVQLHGEEKARNMMEQWLLPKVKEESLPPEQRQLAQITRENAELKAQIEGGRKQQAEARAQQEQQQLIQQFETQIINSLKIGGVPQTESTAGQMAKWMEIGLSNGIEYTPQQLNEIVREENKQMVDAYTSFFVNQITEAKKSGDSATIIKCGQELADYLGEPVVYALAKYHLSKAAQQNPMMPQQSVISTPRVAQEPQKKKSGYMSEEEYREERLKRVAAMERGEQVSETW